MYMSMISVPNKLKLNKVSKTKVRKTGCKLDHIRVVY